MFMKLEPSISLKLLLNSSDFEPNNFINFVHRKKYTIIPLRDYLEALKWVAPIAEEAWIGLLH